MTKRLAIVFLVGFAGLLAGCGSSRSSSTQPASNQTYSMVVTPSQITLNEGDWSAPIVATVELSTDNGTPKAVSPQPAVKYFSSSPLVTISAHGEVCAGQWDASYAICSPTATLPAGYVTVQAIDASHGVSASVTVSVHLRAAKISLGATVFPGPIGPGQLPGTTNIPVGEYPAFQFTNGTYTQGGCISQNNLAAATVTVNGQPSTVTVNNSQALYTGTAVDANGNAIPSCTCLDANGNRIPGCSLAIPGCIHDNDYTWTTENSTVAQVDTFGNVVAHNPGVTAVRATLNGTSGTLDFVTCPPDSIVLSTSPFGGATLLPPFTTADLTLSPGDQRYLNATVVDTDGNPLIASPLTYVTSDPLAVSITNPLQLSATLTAASPGRTTMVASCEPPACNPASAADFITPAGPGTSEEMGFGYPVYSNVIGATVQGSTGSVVLVAGTTFANGSPANQLLVVNSQSLAVSPQPVALVNTPNSLVVSPIGGKAYLGSSAGLMVLDLATFKTSVLDFPVTGELNTFLVTGTVLGVSPHGRYVVVSDPPNLSRAFDPNDSLVFLIDTTGTKAATLFRLPDANISSVAFAGDADADSVNIADGNRLWLGGVAGVYVFQNDAFVLSPTNVSADVTSLAWMPDGQSYFASGAQLTPYSTCQNAALPPPSPNLPSTVTQGLETTAIEGVPHLIGVDGSNWFDYGVTTSAQVGDQTQPSLSALTPNGSGNVCLVSGYAVNLEANPATNLLCTAQQVSFVPPLEEAFITGVNAACTTGESAIHGYNALTGQSVTLTTNSAVVPLSGGALSDGTKLFFGTCAGLNAAGQCADPVNGGQLHRIDLATGSEDNISPVPTAAVAGNVTLIPSFVAVVPK